VWLSKKNQARIDLWDSHLLSRGVQLVLMKLVLRNILVYLSTITNIPKGFLTKIRKECFPFLWFGRKMVGGISMVKWSR
jgi:hypothetical protein